MNEITRVGVDLAKRVIQVHAVDATGRVVVAKALPADKFAAWCVQLPAGCLVAMEACGGAHHWARKLRGYGLDALSRAGINRPGGVGIYRPGRRLPRSVPRGLRSVGHFAADFGARSGIFFGAGPTFGSR